ncbi:YhgE/Pip family protein [Blautia hansenii]|uniref:YhgE/Pip family protein n=1 Tax=Blautia hansenii TaxID=1322 RepID=UPI0039840CA9
MKRAFEIFRRDVNRLSHNMVAMIVTIGVCLIPSLYAWFNIAANYDPYANTGNIKIAVANADKGTENELIGELNVGEEIVQNLKKNDSLGWKFTDEKKAVQGVKSGKYYAAIVIPEDFSSSFVSILSGDMKQPQFEYYLNEKKNAIAPKVTGTGASTIQEQVNEEFIAAAAGSVSKILGQTAEQMGTQVDTVQESLIAKMQTAEENLEEYQVVLENLNKTIDGSDDLINGTQETLDALKSAVASGAKSMNNGTDILASVRNSVGALSVGLSDGLTQGADALSGISSAVGTDLGKLNEKVQNVNEKIGNTITSVQDLIAQNEEILAVLRELDNQVPGSPLSDIIGKLEAENQRHQEILKNLQTGNASIGNAVNTSVQGLNQIAAAIGDGQKSLQTSRKSFEQNVLPSLNQSLDSFAQLSGRVSGILIGVEPSAEQLKNVTGDLKQTLSDTKAAMESSQKALEEVQKKLNTAITDLGTLQSSDIYQSLTELTKKNAEEVAEFMYSPVQLKTESFYHVENYGSAMAPFYTNLAIWVGGIVLIAIFKMEVDRDDKIKSFTATQGYFGRWLLYITTGLIQSLIICLGDIYLLKVQCENPAAFVFAGLLASFVYVNLIYALSITFKHIGKALSVILVILQIPGSAGTYPIEMTQAFFQFVHPLLPFTYGINAMREAIAGIYGMNYWKNLLCLAVFLPLALGIGLLLRPRLLNLNYLFDRKLEETDLMICEEEGMKREKISLSTAVKILAGQDEFRKTLNDKIEKFQSGYRKKIRVGFLAIVVIPIIFLILMFSIDSKMVFLVLWIASIILIALYLIVVEYIHESLKRKKRLSEMSDEVLLKEVKENTQRGEGEQ